MVGRYYATASWSARVYAVARETHGRVCPLCYLLINRVRMNIPNKYNIPSSAPGVLTEGVDGNIHTNGLGF